MPQTAKNLNLKLSRQNPIGRDTPYFAVRTALDKVSNRGTIIL